MALCKASLVCLHCDCSSSDSGEAYWPHNQCVMLILSGLNVVSLVFMCLLIMPCEIQVVWRNSTWYTVASVQGLLLCLFFSCCRGRLNSPVVAERSRIAAKPGFGQKVQRFTPALGLTQSRGKNRTSLMKAHTEEDLQVIAGFLGGRTFDVFVKNQI